MRIHRHNTIVAGRGTCCRTGNQTWHRVFGSHHPGPNNHASTPRRTAAFLSPYRQPARSRRRLPSPISAAPSPSPVSMEAICLPLCSSRFPAPKAVAMPHGGGPELGVGNADAARVHGAIPRGLNACHGKDLSDPSLPLERDQRYVRRTNPDRSHHPNDLIRARALCSRR